MPFKFQHLLLNKTRRSNSKTKLQSLGLVSLLQRLVDDPHGLHVPVDTVRETALLLVLQVRALLIDAAGETPSEEVRDGMLRDRESVHRSVSLDMSSVIICCWSSWRRLAMYFSWSILATG